MKTSTLIGIVSLGISALAGAEGAATTLRIGDKAPSLTGGNVLQGPVPTKFKKGTVYFLDFWATWCGPCTAAMPYVEALHKNPKYKGKVVVMGMDVFENSHGMPYDLKKSRSFIAKHPNLKYPVIADGANGGIAKRFLTAAGLTSIPTFMIVDASGRIAWMNGSCDEAVLSSFEPTLDRVVAGQFDVKAYRSIFEQCIAEDKVLSSAFNHLDGGMYRAAFDEVEPLSPHSARLTKMRDHVRINSIVHLDAVKAIAVADELKARYKDDPDQQEYIDGAFTGKGLPPECYAYGIRAYEASLARSPSWWGFQGLAIIYGHVGNFPKAVDAMRKAIDGIKSSAIPKEDQHYSLDFCKELLACYLDGKDYQAKSGSDQM